MGFKSLSSGSDMGRRGLPARLGPTSENAAQNHRIVFPAGSIHLDSALVMTDIAVEWHSLGSLSPATASRCLRQPEVGQTEQRWCAITQLVCCVDHQ